MPQTKLTEDFIKHQLLLQRLGGSWWRDAQKILARIEKDVIAVIDDDKADAYDLYRYSKIEKEVLEIIENSNLTRDQISKIEEFVEYEQSFVIDKISDVVTVKLEALELGNLVKAVNGSRLELIAGKNKQQFTLKSLYRKLHRSQSRNIGTIVAAGSASGKTTDEIIEDVRAIAFRRNRAEVESVVMTSLNHVATQTRKEIVNINDDIFEGWEFFATLDSFTTLICAALDGQVLPKDTDKLPPLHYRCRSCIKPYVKEHLLIDPGGGKRASEFGPQNAKITYDGFLRKQSREYQDAFLGKEKAKLFRRGMPLKKFVNDNGIVYDINELKRLDKL